MVARLTSRDPPCLRFHAQFQAKITVPLASEVLALCKLTPKNMQILILQIEVFCLVTNSNSNVIFMFWVVKFTYQ